MVDALAGLIDLKVEPHNGVALTVQLSDQLRCAITTGRLSNGRRLPSSRELAHYLKVSRNTITAVIDQLAMEGYLDVSKGRRPTVAAMPSASLIAVESVSQRPANTTGMSKWAQQIGRSIWPFAGEGRPKPFEPCLADPREFPHEIWGRCLRAATRHSLLRRNMGCNRPDLQKALLHHLIEYRGVNADAQQVLLMPTAQAAIALIARVVLDPGDIAWVESPGYGGARAAFEAAGAMVQGVALDHAGLTLDTSRDTPRLIFVTPAHQHPTGLLMPATRRQALLRFVARAGAQIIEDDYDSEFHFEGRPVAALQGSDQADSVFYVGTFSKSLHADIRVGYVVVPKRFVQVFTKAQRHTGQIVSMSLQDSLSDFISEGHYAAHIRKMTRIYRARRDYLCRALGNNTDLNVLPPDGGMQIVARLGPSHSDLEVCRRLGDVGVVVRPLSPHYVDEPLGQGLFLGFAAWNEEEIDAGVQAIARVLRH